MEVEDIWHVAIGTASFKSFQNLVEFVVMCMFTFFIKTDVVLDSKTINSDTFSDSINISIFYVSFLYLPYS